MKVKYSMEGNHAYAYAVECPNGKRSMCDLDVLHRFDFPWMRDMWIKRDPEKRQKVSEWYAESRFDMEFDERGICCQRLDYRV